jgi:hypothetical protein
MNDPFIGLGATLMHFEEMCRDCPLLFYLLDKRSLLDLRLSPPQDEGAGPVQ